jgi:hypothetical protein
MTSISSSVSLMGFISKVSGQAGETGITKAQLAKSLRDAYADQNTQFTLEKQNQKSLLSMIPQASSSPLALFSDMFKMETAESKKNHEAAEASNPFVEIAENILLKKDGDGNVFFDNIDSNDDGTLTISELDTFAQFGSGNKNRIDGSDFASWNDNIAVESVVVGITSDEANAVAIRNLAGESVSSSSGSSGAMDFLKMMFPQIAMLLPGASSSSNSVPREKGAVGAPKAGGNGDTSSMLPLMLMMMAQSAPPPSAPPSSGYPPYGQIPGGGNPYGQMPGGGNPYGQIPGMGGSPYGQIPGMGGSPYGPMAGMGGSPYGPMAGMGGSPYGPMAGMGGSPYGPMGGMSGNPYNPYGTGSASDPFGLGALGIG